MIYELGLQVDFFNLLIKWLGFKNFLLAAVFSEC